MEFDDVDAVRRVRSDTTNRFVSARERQTSRRERCGQAWRAHGIVGVSARFEN